MGVNRKDLQLLVRLAEQGHIKPCSKIVEIGAQQLSNSFLRSEDLVRKAEAALGAPHPYPLPAPGPVVLAAGRVELQDSAAPFARSFWTSLGFDYAAIDVDGSPGSIPLDLNFDETPAGLRGKYDLVTNLGTTEHICNQLNAFKAIHDLAGSGAVMIHHLPAGGAPNHGLVNYNPKFFWHLARSNDYKWLYMDFLGGDEPYPVPENILEYVERYEPTAAKTMQGRKTADYAVQIALQKTLDIPFVPPLDVDSNARTDDAALNRRYWTVFQPGVLESVKRGGDMPKWVSETSADETGAEESGDLNDGWSETRLARPAGDISDEVRRALDRKVASASHEIRVAVTRAIADSEQNVRTSLDRKVSNSEEAIRKAIGRKVSDSEESIRVEISRTASDVAGR